MALAARAVCTLQKVTENAECAAGRHPKPHLLQRRCPFSSSIRVRRAAVSRGQWPSLTARTHTVCAPAQSLRRCWEPHVSAFLHSWTRDSECSPPLRLRSPRRLALPCGRRAQRRDGRTERTSAQHSALPHPSSLHRPCPRCPMHLSSEDDGRVGRPACMQGCADEPVEERTRCTGADRINARGLQYSRGSVCVGRFCGCMCNAAARTGERSTQLARRARTALHTPEHKRPRNEQ